MESNNVWNSRNAKSFAPMETRSKRQKTDPTQEEVKLTEGDLD